MLDSHIYLTEIGQPQFVENSPPGPELIMPEIVAILRARASCVYLPFPQTGALAKALGGQAIRTVVGSDCLIDPYRKDFEMPKEAEQCDAVYFGTPTIVDGQCLFTKETFYDWDAEVEMQYVRQLVAACEANRYTTIVSGLGSGDITVEQRVAAMGGGDVVAYKHFGQFEDWVIARFL
mgnify:CR=1 FL=1|tara:strand:+ start:3592 stop:4125 length:534 start_codon:yes stop_codon:yes gene_type:complete